MGGKLLELWLRPSRRFFHGRGVKTDRPSEVFEKLVGTAMSGMVTSAGSENTTGLVFRPASLR